MNSGIDKRYMDAAWSLIAGRNVTDIALLLEAVERCTCAENLNGTTGYLKSLSEKQPNISDSQCTED